MSVQYAVPRAGLPAASTLRRWSAAAVERPVSVTLRFVDEVEGRQLNRDYRGRDYATNVLTFCYGETPEGLLGDIVLCAPVIAREAAEQRKTLRAHYVHLLVHGLLHLQGYDHECEGDARHMEELEITILADLGFANPYAEEHAPA